MSKKKKKKHAGWAGNPPKERPAVHVAPCELCGLKWPWPAQFGQVEERLKARICQVCLMAGPGSRRARMPDEISEPPDDSSAPGLAFRGGVGTVR